MPAARGVVILSEVNISTPTGIINNCLKLHASLNGRGRASLIMRYSLKYNRIKTVKSTIVPVIHITKGMFILNVLNAFLLYGAVVICCIFIGENVRVELAVIPELAVLLAVSWNTGSSMPYLKGSQTGTISLIAAIYHKNIKTLLGMWLFKIWRRIITRMIRIPPDRLIFKNITAPPLYSALFIISLSSWISSGVRELPDNKAAKNCFLEPLNILPTSSSVS